MEKDKKFLLVDDNRDLLDAVHVVFPSILIRECHSTADALCAIKEVCPDVLFLDHQLTRDGNEGFEVADQTSGVKIYSTTSNSSPSITKGYKRRGIEVIGKTDINKLSSIIDG